MERSIGLFGATSVGVGAIVGGGILALSGIAFASTGPSAIIAFAFNGVIAVLTALSFAEMAAAFPESGGTYTFSKKVLSAPAGFMVGWVIWFASVVASVLYALGFAFFAANALDSVLQLIPISLPFSVTSKSSIIFLALLATTGYSLSLIYQSSGGGQWATWGKVGVFIVIIVAGFWHLIDEPFSSIQKPLSPFFINGATGLFQAMGYTFISLQGFDLIAAIAGEVKNPKKCASCNDAVFRYCTCHLPATSFRHCNRRDPSWSGHCSDGVG
ncbi:MAG: APC family permease [Desulfobacterales bacterium]